MDARGGMSSGRALVAAIVIVLVILIVAAYVWYHYTGWGAPFSFEASLYPSTLACAEACPTTAPSSPFPCVVGSPCCVSAGPKAPGACYSRIPCITSNNCPEGQTCAGGYCTPVAPPSWQTKADSRGRARGIDRLRFKDVVFTVTDPSGTVHNYDVTAVLNAMAKAYRRSPSAIPQVLSLDRPLNAFSFVIPGVNDQVSADDLAPWVDVAVKLTGWARTI